MLQFKAKGTRDSCESHLKDSIGRQKSEKTHCLSLICCEMILILVVVLDLDLVIDLVILSLLIIISD